jgi:hypothetical protein
MLTQACSNSGESDGVSFAADGASFAADGASFAADGAARAAVGTASSEHEGNEAPKNPRIAQRTYVALYPWWWHHTTGYYVTGFSSEDVDLSLERKLGGRTSSDLLRVGGALAWAHLRNSSSIIIHHQFITCHHHRISRTQDRHERRPTRG